MGSFSPSVRDCLFLTKGDPCDRAHANGYEFQSLRDSIPVGDGAPQGDDKGLFISYLVQGMTQCCEQQVSIPR